MSRTLACDLLRTGASERNEINVAKEAFPRAQEHWAYRQIQLIDESGAKILLNGGDAAPDTNVFPIRRRCGSLEGAVDSIRHEMERRSSLHRDRFARVVGLEDAYGPLVLHGGWSTLAVIAGEHINKSIRFNSTWT